MSSEERLRTSMERGARAKALLQNELLNESFDNIEKVLMQEWKLTAPDDKDRREDAWKSLRLLEMLRAGLSRAVTDGEVSAKELLQLKKPNVIRRMIR